MILSMSASLLQRLAGIVSMMYLARVLGPERLGAYNFALAFVGYFGIFVSLGLDDYGILKVSSMRDSELVCRQASTIVSLRVMISIFLFMLLYICTEVTARLFDIRDITLVLGCMLFGIALSTEWVFIALDKIELVSTIRMVGRFIYLIGIFVLVRSPQDLLVLVWLSVVTELLTPLTLCILLEKIRGKVSLGFEFKEWWAALKHSFSLTVSSVLGLIRLNMDLIMVAFFLNSNETGLYAAILAFVNVGITLAAVLRQTVFARIVKSYNNIHMEDITQINSVSLRYGAAIGTAIGFVGGAFAPQIILIMFGSKYLSAIPAFRVIVWVLALNFIGLALPHTLMAHNKGKYLEVSFYATLLNVVLNILLIPKYGIMGAAISYVISTVCWMVLFYYHLCIKESVLPGSIGWLIIKPLFSALLCFLFVFLAGEFNIVAVIFVSVFLYWGLLIITKHLSYGQIKLDFSNTRS